MNFYIPHNRRTPLQAEEALGPISIPRGSRVVSTIYVYCIYTQCIAIIGNVYWYLIIPLMRFIQVHIIVAVSK